MKPLNRYLIFIEVERLGCSYLSYTYSVALFNGQFVLLIKNLLNEYSFSDIYEGPKII